MTQEGSVNNSGIFCRILLHPLFIPGAIAIGLLLRILIACLIPIAPASDAAWYAMRAQEMTAGLGYQESGFPTAYWPVGWPGILAGGLFVFDSMFLTVVILNTLAAGLVMWLILWFAREVSGNEFIARLALLTYVLYPNHIAYHGAANSETVYAAISMLAFMLLIKGRDSIGLLIVSGLVFGVATLVKPQTLLFPFGAVISLAIVYNTYSWLKAARAGLVVYVCMLLVVLPWSIRNYLVMDEFVLVSTNGGTALILGANDQMTGGHFDYQLTPAFEQLGIPWEQRVERQVELNQRQKEAASQWISENTGEWLMWMPKKVLGLWIKDTDGFWSFDRQYPNSTVTIRIFQAINQLYYCIILLLSGVGALIAAKAILQQKWPTIKLGFLYCMPVFVTLQAAVFTGQIRYHHGAMPYLIVGACYVFLKVLERRKYFNLRIGTTQFYNQ